MSLTAAEEMELIQLLEEDQAQGVYDGTHLSFMQATWIKQAPFLVGFHTRRICEAIDRAIARYREGKSTYLLINVHHRVGKSDIVSRYLGPHFLGLFPDAEIIQTSYQANLAAQFSTFGRNIVKSPRYQAIFPDIHLSSETNRKNDWVLVDDQDQPTGGRLYASGLQSGLTGNGYMLGIVDDYCRGRAQAESLCFRNSTWEAFTNDFLTRAAPVSITIVLATQWHMDDLSGRIRREMEEDQNFPRFEILSFPARASDYYGEGKYQGEYLFEERLGKNWYLTQYATLGPYSSAALLDCNPMLRTGGRFNVENIDWVSSVPEPTQRAWARIWDLAHTTKQRAGDDPDWTSGTRLAFEMRVGDPVPHLWVADVVRTRENAAARDEIIKHTAKCDTHYTRQCVESTIDSKDAYDYLSRAMPDISWHDIRIVGDKSARATPLEPIFAMPGHVHVQIADWNDDWIDELMRFDGSGKDHDDQVDNLSAGYLHLVESSTAIDQKYRDQMRALRGR